MIGAKLIGSIEWIPHLHLVEYYNILQMADSDSHRSIFKIFENISFEELIRRTLKEANETVWSSGDPDRVTQEEADNMKKRALEQIEDLKNNHGLNKLYNTLKLPFVESELIHKASVLSESILASLSHADKVESEYNIINFTWDLSLDPSLSLFYDLQHHSKPEMEYMDFGKEIKWIPWKIDIMDYFGDFIAFESADTDYLLVETEDIMLIYEGYKLQFNSVLEESVKNVQRIKKYSDKYFYVSEFQTDSTLLLDTGRL